MASNSPNKQSLQKQATISSTSSNASQQRLKKAHSTPLTDVGNNLKKRQDTRSMSKQSSNDSVLSGRDRMGFQVMTKRVTIKEKEASVPGDPKLYDVKPPRIDYYDVFYFETRVRDMIEEYMEPFK